MKKLISEDQMMPNSSRQTMGVTAKKNSKGDTSPEALKVRQMLDANKDNDNSKAPIRKIEPLDKVDEVISDMFLSSSNLRSILSHGGNNIQAIVEDPKKREEYLHHIAYASRRLEIIDKAIVDISRELDKIV
jgi:hypothetical protein